MGRANRSTQRAPLSPFTLRALSSTWVFFSLSLDFDHRFLLLLAATSTEVHNVPLSLKLREIISVAFLLLLLLFLQPSAEKQRGGTPANCRQTCRGTDRHALSPSEEKFRRSGLSFHRKDNRHSSVVAVVNSRLHRFINAPFTASSWPSFPSRRRATSIGTVLQIFNRATSTSSSS